MGCCPLRQKNREGGHAGQQKKGPTHKERVAQSLAKVGIKLGEAVGHTSWRREDDPDKIISVIYNTCQNNYLTVGTGFFCMCVGGSERPYQRLVKLVQDRNDPLLSSGNMVQFVSTNMHKNRTICPEAGLDAEGDPSHPEALSKLGDVSDEILYWEAEDPGRRILSKGAVATKRDVFMVFQQFLELAASFDIEKQCVFDNYVDIIKNACIKSQEDKAVLKLDPRALTFKSYSEIAEDRWSASPHPELWAREYGGYFDAEKCLDHPEKLQTYSLGMMFGMMLLGEWLLSFPTYISPLFRQKVDFEHFQKQPSQMGFGASSLDDDATQGTEGYEAAHEPTSPLESDQAFHDFVQALIEKSKRCDHRALDRGVIDEVLADEAFMHDWRSMLLYKAADRPTAREMLDAATWTQRCVVVTLQAPQPPLNADSIVTCISASGTEIASYSVKTHDSLGSIRAALAHKVGVPIDDVQLLLPSGELLKLTDDGKLVVDCLQLA